MWSANPPFCQHDYVNTLRQGVRLVAGWVAPNFKWLWSARRKLRWEVKRTKWNIIVINSAETKTTGSAAVTSAVTWLRWSNALHVPGRLHSSMVVSHSPSDRRMEIGTARHTAGVN